MIALSDIQHLLADQNPAATERLAQEAAALTRRHFGRAMTLYTPLYLSNYCSSHCTYCGFHSHNRIERLKLSPEDMKREMAALAKTGVQNILLLTGESYQATPLTYLTEAAGIAKSLFTGVAMEIHPLETEDYRALFAAGVDGITVYQETYDRARYAEVHLSGIKKDYDFRYGTPARAAAAGMRQIAMGILLGLSDPARDLFALYAHLRWMERHFPGVEYSVSFPRMRKIKGRAFAVCDIDDAALIKIICLTRILFPRVGINLSTRERPHLRDRALELGVTRISAGSNTAVGGYTLKPLDQQDPQFDIEDTRSVQETLCSLKALGFDPVLTDWRPIENTPLPTDGDGQKKEFALPPR